ncbi:MAG: YceD family protein [Acholeplasmataceae bacterium]
MKWLLQDLSDRKDFDCTVDYRSYIAAIADMLDIKPARVAGGLQVEGDRVIADITVDVHLTLGCSKTLRPVEYPMHFTARIVFGTDEKADYLLEDPLDLEPIVFGYIVSEKPYTIYHPDADVADVDDAKQSHPAFADLDQLYGK